MDIKKKGEIYMTPQVLLSLTLILLQISSGTGYQIMTDKTVEPSNPETIVEFFENCEISLEQQYYETNLD